MLARGEDIVDTENINNDEDIVNVENIDNIDNHEMKEKTMTVITSFSSESSSRRNKLKSSLESSSQDSESQSLYFLDGDDRFRKPIILNHIKAIVDEIARTRMKEMKSHAKLARICLWKTRAEDEQSRARSGIPRAKDIRSISGKEMLNGDREKEMTITFLTEHKKSNREAIMLNANTEKALWQELRARERQEAEREDKCTPRTYRALARRIPECLSQIILVKFPASNVNSTSYVEEVAPTLQGRCTACTEPSDCQY
eukprot:8445192-Karenia_brevis.AAC.1